MCFNLLWDLWVAEVADQSWVKQLKGLKSQLPSCYGILELGWRMSLCSELEQIPDLMATPWLLVAFVMYVPDMVTALDFCLLAAPSVTNSAFFPSNDAF